MFGKLESARPGAAASLVFMCLLWLTLLSSPVALSAEPAPEADGKGMPFATVWRIRGQVFAAGGIPGGNRLLGEGATVYVGDRVRAGADAEAVLRTLDAGAIAVRPGAEFVAERFVAAGKPTDSSLLRIVTGSLRLITGWIGQINRGGHRIITPTATIGIRGTDHEPYVMSSALAAKTSHKEGTYDKVNRGMTALEVGEQSLEIEAGKVGFAQAPKRAFKQRALMTVLMPVLLDKIPDFYVPGEFDAELDQFSEIAGILSRRELERIGGRIEPAAPAAEPPAEGAPTRQRPPETGPAAAAAATTVPDAGRPAGCDPAALGKAWIEALDGAIMRLDGPAIVVAFAPDVAVRATVRNKEGGVTTVELGRDELARSTLAAVGSLEGYRHRRVSLSSTLAAPPDCNRVAIKSVVIEQGRQSGKSFRFESLEEYLIELRDGRWLAIRAETTQR